MPGKVLIVDDSKMERAIITTSIRRRLLEEIEIFEKADGEGIVELLIEEKIQACILDIQLPKKNGFDILKEIKENKKTQDVVVLVCTGMTDEQSIEKALSLGAYDYFLKPLSQEVMDIALPLKIKNAIALTVRNEQIMFLSYHDNLTGLYNRRYLEMELDNYERENEKLTDEKKMQFAIIIGDANGLKLTNDAFGHEAGDILLKKIATIMQNSLPQNSIIARIGGDEFAIILKNVTEEQLSEYIERIKNLCLEEKGEPLKPNISFGYSIQQSKQEKIKDVYRRAEDFMYSNKIKESTKIKKSILRSLMSILHEKNAVQSSCLKQIETLSLKIGKEIKIGFNEKMHLKLLAQYHDIGLTAASLREEDVRIYKNQVNQIKDNHCEIGFRIANALPDIAPIGFEILSHHEKWDGTGYPQHLRGTAIPLNARILYMVEHYIKWIDKVNQLQLDQETFSEISKEEIYLRVKKEVLNGMILLSGSFFDPMLVDVLLEIELRENAFHDQDKKELLEQKKRKNIKR